MVEVEHEEKGSQNCRTSLKTHDSFNNHSSWKHKLRENCFKRVREDRTRLIWKLRLPAFEDQSTSHKDSITSTFRDIVSDELQKIKGSYLDENSGYPTSSAATDEMIWEYDGLHTAYQGDCEEILLEMQKIFYEDEMEEIKKESKSCIKTWEDEEDEYLARIVYEHMQLNKEKVEQVWCPICKKGELQEVGHHISCTQCELRLERDDEVTRRHWD